MKLQVTRKDGQPIIGKKKSLTFTISDDLQKLSKASEKDFLAQDLDNEEWDVYYQTEGMYEDSKLIDMVFTIKDYERTLEPKKLLYWSNSIIEHETEFNVTTNNTRHGKRGQDKEGDREHRIQVHGRDERRSMASQFY